MRLAKCLLVLSAIAALQPGRVQAAFLVSPMEHRLQVPAGQRGSSTVLIRNSGEQPLTLKLYLADSRFEPSGRERELPLGSLDRSCAPWTTLEAELLELQPGELHRVNIELAPPAGARGSYWAKLYVEEMSTPSADQHKVKGRSYQVFMRQRMGVRIFEDVPGTEERGAVVNHVKVATAGDTLTVTLSVQNTGNAVLQCQGTVELRNSRGEVLATLLPGAKGKFFVFPGGGRELPVRSTLQLPPDAYTVLAVVDYGGESLVAGEESFQIKPPPGKKTPPPAIAEQSRRARP
jgi:P pilus assembly chaperone PapD